MDKKRILYLDILRIAACIAVIGIHVASSSFYGSRVGDTGFVISAFWLSVVHWSVPVFVMISGAHFLSPSVEIDSGKLYRRNVLRVLLVFILWSVVYALAGVNAYHLWFLLMMAGLYVITPLLRKITEDEKATRYFLIIAAVYMSAVFLKDLAGALVIHQKSALIIKIYDVLNTDFEYVNWQFPAGYVIFYVLGAYLAGLEIPVKIRRVIYVLVLPMVLGSWYITLLASRLKEGAFPFYSEGSLPQAVIAAGVFLAVKGICSRTDKTGNDTEGKPGAVSEGKSAKAVHYLAKCTLGIYVTHLFFFDLIGRYGPGNTVPAVIFIPGAMIAVFLVSFAVTAILRLIPGFNRIFI